MAEHRAEQIMAAVKTAVTGLVTTGPRSYRARTWPTVDADLPCVLVYMGADNYVEDGAAFDVMRSALDVTVEAVVKRTSIQVDTLLNQIRQEVEVALLADHTLGLGFVHRMGFVRADEPDLEALEQPVARMRITFSALYERSWADPSQ